MGWWISTTATVATVKRNWIESATNVTTAFHSIHSLQHHQQKEFGVAIVTVAVTTALTANFVADLSLSGVEGLELSFSQLTFPLWELTLLHWLRLLNLLRMTMTTTRKMMGMTLSQEMNKSISFPLLNSSSSFLVNSVYSVYLIFPLEEITMELRMMMITEWVHKDVRVNDQISSWLSRSEEKWKGWWEMTTTTVFVNASIESNGKAKPSEFARFITERKVCILEETLRRCRSRNQFKIRNLSCYTQQ